MRSRLRSSGWRPASPAASPSSTRSSAAGVSGDLGYVVAIEHSVSASRGGPPTQIDLRVTIVFRREGDAWRVVHGHGDPYDQSTRDVLAARADAAVATASGTAADRAHTAPGPGITRVAPRPPGADPVVDGSARPSAFAEPLFRARHLRVREHRTTAS